MSKKNTLDQYYTSPKVASFCWDIIKSRYPDWKEFNYVEPSAGEGVFLRDDVRMKAYDLEPKHWNVEEKDFLLTQPFNHNVFVVGNPPFGFAGSTAVKFINHASDVGADKIGFILPKTFKKVLFREKLFDKLHLVAEEDLPKNSFILEGKPYDVPCVFQIYEKMTVVRNLVSFDDVFVKTTAERYDFIIKRVGGRAGEIIDVKDFNPSSCYKILGDKGEYEKILPRIRVIREFTAGVRSVSINDINLEYNLFKNIKESVE